jgi:hypothetical protein
MPKNSRLSPSSYRPGATEIRDYSFDLAGMASADRRSTLFGNRAPNAGDDVDAGFRKGSIWIYDERAFFCTDSTPSAAIWVEIGLGAQSPYVLTLLAGSVSPPAGGSTYYMSQVADLAPLSASANRTFIFGVSGTIFAVSASTTVSGTLGAGQGGNGKIAILDLVTSVQTDLLLNQQYVAGSNNTPASGINVPIIEGRPYSLVVITPSFTTAPTTVRHQVNLYVRPALS